MQNPESQRLCQVLEDLTGQRPPLPAASELVSSFPSEGLGCSQLNELLLLLGYDRVTEAFFQFLVDGALDYKPGSELTSIDDLNNRS